MKHAVWIGLTIGATLGSYAGASLDQGNVLGLWSFLCGTVGSIVGIWLGYTIYKAIQD